MFKNKNKGLSESERLQKMQIEKQIAESQKRLNDNLPGFKYDYNKLVEQYGLIHVIRYDFDQTRGFYATIEIQDVWPQVQKVKEERAKQVVKPAEGVVKN